MQTILGTLSIFFFVIMSLITLFGWFLCLFGKVSYGDLDPLFYSTFGCLILGNQIFKTFDD